MQGRLHAVATPATRFEAGFRRLAASLGLLAFLASLTACVSARRMDTGRYGLVEVRLTSRNPADFGRLPWFDEPRPATGYFPAFAGGTLEVSGDGRLAIRVDATQATVGIGGRERQFRFVLLDFFGLLNEESEDRVPRQRPNPADLSGADELRFESAGVDGLWVTPRRAGRDLPYRFRFLLGVQSPAIVMPTL